MIPASLSDLFRQLKAEEIVPLSPPPVHDARWFTQMIAEQQEQKPVYQVKRVIVSKTFAERWTTNPEHYRKYYHADDVQIEEGKR